jgi:hypothetical protein
MSATEIIPQRRRGGKRQKGRRYIHQEHREGFGIKQEAPERPGPVGV